ncbi:hypothetical protein IFT68_11915 [Oxalobacteraceae sp. CFBP 13730]|nr:hypothetical protein [Oxalobacteraceae sp. CFBP 13730]
MMVGNLVHGASMRLARSQGTSFPRRREPKFVAPSTRHALLATLAPLGSRLRGNDGGMPAASSRLALAHDGSGSNA